MDQDDLLSIEQYKPYLSEWHGVRKVQGLYFLIKDGTISYIGSSVHLMSRLAQHLRRHDFDEALVLEMNGCNERLMRNIENTLIKRLKPPINKQSDTILKFVNRNGKELNTVELLEMAKSTALGKQVNPYSTSFMRTLT